MILESKPTLVTVKNVEFDGTIIENFPSKSVVATIEVPSNEIEAPGIGKLDSSKIKPMIFRVS